MMESGKVVLLVMNQQRRI